MKRFVPLCGLLFTLGLGATGTGQEKEKDKKVPTTFKVILLLDAKTKGITGDTKIKQIQFTNESKGKREIKDSKVLEKNQPRLNGIYVVKEGTILLADGMILEKQEVLIAIEVGKQTLKNVEFLETCVGQTEKGSCAWYAFKAECVLLEKVK